ncbi:MAG: carbon-nitrogen hydrolase family protein [bacterium]|nr:carbon-nitrogen hydrolase family protein [bacterium]
MPDAMLRTSPKVAAIAMRSVPDLAASLEEAERWVERAVRDGAEAVGLPENFPRISLTPAEGVQAASLEAERARAWLSATARRHGIVMWGGLHVPATAGKVHNTLVLVDARGQEVTHYRKRHLFDVSLGGHDEHRESAHVEPGDEVVTADLGSLGTWGLAICYDLRFPEHFRAREAHVWTVPAAFLTRTGAAHWHVLLRARAIENQAFVVAPAQAGQHHPTRRSHGHALIVDPWGTVLADTGPEPGVAIARLDFAWLAEVRRSLPALMHRLPSG